MNAMINMDIILYANIHVHERILLNGTYSDNTDFQGCS